MVGSTKTHRLSPQRARIPMPMRRSPLADAVSAMRKVGDLRPSQMLYTFGVGSIVELPNLSVMIMGLDDWPVEQGAREITEPRLLRAVQYELGMQAAKLLSPPMAPESTRVEAGTLVEVA